MWAGGAVPSKKHWLRSRHAHWSSAYRATCYSPSTSSVFWPIIFPRPRWRSYIRPMGTMDSWWNSTNSTRYLSIFTEKKSAFYQEKGVNTRSVRIWMRRAGSVSRPRGICRRESHDPQDLCEEQRQEETTTAGAIHVRQS